MNWALLKNSLLVSSSATLLAVALGFVAALWLSSLPRRWRDRFLMASIIALVLPSFLVTNCWLYLFGYTGVGRSWVGLNIYSLWGTVWILALLTWPVTLLLVLGWWQRLERAQFESDPALTGWPLIRWLLWPHARTALRQSIFLTFVLALNNFAVPSLLQTKVYPSELWVSFNTTFDYASALGLSVPLIIAPLLLLLWFRDHRISWPNREGSVPARIFRRQLGTRWLWGCGIITLLLLFVSVGLPLVQLTASIRTWTELGVAWSAGQSALINSFFYAFGTATLCGAISLLSWRWPIGLILWLPFLAPGVLLGIVFIATFNHPMFAVFYQSGWLVILAFTVRYLAIGWNGVAQANKAIDRDLIEVACLDGASFWQMLRYVRWPQISAQVGVVWYVTYLLCLWDVETLVLIVPPGGETLAVRIFNFLHYGHNSQVNALCLLLLFLALVPILLWKFKRWVMARSFPRSKMVWAFVLLGLAGCSRQESKETMLHSQFFSSVQVIGSRGTGLGHFNKPRSVAVDAQDNLYVVDMTGRVQKFSPGGQFLLSWQMPQTDKGKPKGMCRDGEGNIIVIEPHYSRLNHYSPTGKLVVQWGENGTNAGQIFFPRAVAVNSKGEIYVSEYGVTERLQRFSPGGTRCLASLGTAGDKPGDFNRPEGLGVDVQDRVYVADSCNHRIQVFSDAGEFLHAYGHAGSAPGQLSYPYDVRVDAAGRQYVCEFGNSRVQIFDAAGHSLELLGRPGSSPGEFSNPWSIALDSVGNLYVADSLNHRVQKFIARSNAKPSSSVPKHSSQSESGTLPSRRRDMLQSEIYSPHMGRARLSSARRIVGGFVTRRAEDRRALPLPGVIQLTAQTVLCGPQDGLHREANALFP